MEKHQTFHENSTPQIDYLRMITKIALIDDHAIFCDSLSGLINDFDGFSVSWCAHDDIKAIEMFE
jgi:hypothetical protein